MDSERYSRQIMLPEVGADGQKRLADARVAIIGLGGLGAPVATYLAGAGVGTILLFDPDTVSASNLQRQVLYTEAEIGLPKATCAARRLAAQNSFVTLIPCTGGLTAENGMSLLRGCGLVVDCTDNYPARYLIDDLCERLAIPWVYGSIGELSGQVSVFGGKSGLRYRDLFAERDELCAQPHTTRGVIGAVPGVVGAVEACEAIKMLVGCGDPLDGRLFSIDLLSMESNIIDLKPLLQHINP